MINVKVVMACFLATLMVPVAWLTGFPEAVPLLYGALYCDLTVALVCHNLMTAFAMSLAVGCTAAAFLIPPGSPGWQYFFLVTFVAVTCDVVAKLSKVVLDGHSEYRCTAPSSAPTLYFTRGVTTILTPLAPSMIVPYS